MRAHHFPTIFPEVSEWGYEATELTVAFNLCEDRRAGTINYGRKVPETIVRWGRTKENLPIATREAIRGLCFSAVINLDDEHLNSREKEGDGM